MISGRQTKDKADTGRRSTSAEGLKEEAAIAAAAAPETFGVDEAQKDQTTETDKGHSFSDTVQD